MATTSLPVPTTCTWWAELGRANWSGREGLGPELQAKSLPQSTALPPPAAPDLPGRLGSRFLAV